MDTDKNQPTLQQQRQHINLPAFVHFKPDIEDLDRVENYLLDAQARQFKEWAIELSSYFTAVGSLWNEKERSFSDNQKLISAYYESQYPTFARRLHRAQRELATFVCQLSEHAQRVYHIIFRRYLLRFYLQSPFLRRAYEKPRGYPGDYLMMDMLYRHEPQGSTLFGRAMDQYALHEEGAEMVRNRPQYLIEKICEAVDRRKSNRVRVANIGCGTAEEIFVLLTTLPDVGQYLDLTLVDQDKEALAYCLNRLSPLADATGAMLEVVCEPVKRLFIEDYARRFLAGNHLIYSAGLFDYFNTEVFQKLLQLLYDNVCTDGTLVIGNVDPEVPSRWLMEYANNWFIIYKTAVELQRMAYRLKPLPSQIVVEAEASGFNHFLVIYK